jgi:monoamine oxidase
VQAPVAAAIVVPVTLEHTMAHTPCFRRWQRWIAAATLAEREGVPADEALHRLASRRRVLQAGAAAAALGPLALRAAPGARGAEVAIVGAGLAGLYAATLLQGKSAAVRLFEADTRVGGRVWSLRGHFPGQVAERGGELIDTTHVTLRGLANAYGLTLESYAASQLPGEESFYFDGRHYSEAQVVEEFRAFVPALKDDLARLSNGPTATAYNEHDRRLDFTSLADYLLQRGAGPLIRQVLDVAYTIEFGREIAQQSSLAMLFFIAANRRKSFTPFGVFSDERFHIVEGNDAVPTRMAAGLARPVELGHRLLRVARRADGRIELTFDLGAARVQTLHDAAVLTLPAPAMREVEFHTSLALPAANRFAIDHLDYGTSSKLMIGFHGRPWWERHASNGSSLSDLANHQSTWESNPSQAVALQRGLLTDFSGGERGARLDPRRTAAEADAFLADLDRVWPGSAALARRDGRGRPLAHLENWARLPLYGGGYTNNQPGYFTMLEGLYARPAGNLHFAGEHTDSFYSYQGFMEGALLSGARAADEVLRGLR